MQAIKDKDIYLKLENMQITGAFKIRGALNSILENDHFGIKNYVTASAGNHGAGVSYAASLLEKKSIIVLPEHSPKTKVDRLKRLGADLKIVGKNWNESNQIAKEIAETNDCYFIHPFADENVIAGQGTIAKEMLDNVPEIDCIIAAAGGGGLINGLALYAKSVNPNIKIVCVEPEGAETLKHCIEAKKLKSLDVLSTHASSLSVMKTEVLNFELAKSFVDDFVSVSDLDAYETATYLWEHFGIGVELSGAVALASVLKNKVDLSACKKIAVVICGAGQDGFGIN